MTFEIALVLGILAISLIFSSAKSFEWISWRCWCWRPGGLGPGRLQRSLCRFYQQCGYYCLGDVHSQRGPDPYRHCRHHRPTGHATRWSREIAMIIVIMMTAAVLSAFMNNIGVAALMLPVVVEVARRTRIAPSRLLMPLAYSTLLGGLMTMIGTPPNLLISEMMVQNGYEPFELFDFTPLGGAVMVIGVIFVALFGRFLLPKDACCNGTNTTVNAVCATDTSCRNARSCCACRWTRYWSARRSRESDRRLDGTDYSLAAS